MNPRKVVIWGMGNDYESIINQLKFEICKNNIICEALVCRDQDAYVSKKDGFPVVKVSEFYKLKFDYLVIASGKFFDQIRDEAIKMGVEPKCIIDGRLFHQPLFDFKRYVSLIENPITILSDDCWGGFAYNRLQLPFTSPLINISWNRDQYVKFIQKPLYYLDTDLQLVREGDLYEGICPIGRLGNENDYVELNFVHNYNFSSALEQWNRRVKRINRNNIFVKMGFSNADASEKIKARIQAFENVKYKKILFYNGKGNLPEMFKQANERFIGNQKSAKGVVSFDYNYYLITSYFWDLDLLKLLVDGEDYSRY